MNRPMKPIKTKEAFARELKTSNMNILAVVVLSLVNVLMVLLDSSTYFPFCASVPVYLTMIFSELCGMRSEEFYEAAYGPEWTSAEFLPSGLFWGVVVFAAIIIGVYFLLWYLSKKKKGAVTVLMVLYALDTIALLFFNVAVYEFQFMSIIELVFHAWVFYYLILALKALDGIEIAPTMAELNGQYQALQGMTTPADVVDTPSDTDGATDAVDSDAE